MTRRRVNLCSLTLSRCIADTAWAAHTNNCPLINAGFLISCLYARVGISIHPHFPITAPTPHTRVLHPRIHTCVLVFPWRKNSASSEFRRAYVAFCERVCIYNTPNSCCVECFFNETPRVVFLFFLIITYIRRCYNTHTPRVSLSAERRNICRITHARRNWINCRTIRYLYRASVTLLSGVSYMITIFVLTP